MDKTAKFFKEINDHSRATYYVLPLVYLNKFSFGVDNFQNAFCSADGSQVVVQVKDVDKVPGNPWYSEHYIREEDGTFFYNIPLFHKEAVAKFLQGKYSEMGKAAHDLIRAYSGLNYRKLMFDNATQQHVEKTDARLWALELHPDLRDKLEELLTYCGRGIRSAVSISRSSELMSPPQQWEIWKEQKLLA